MSDVHTENEHPHAERTCSYFVDEAGDGTLFNKKKKLILGQEGTSTFFMLGVLEVFSPELLHVELEKLRQDLLNDPTLSSIPSMQTKERKTSLFFHAKDDCAEVRREVYKLLIKHEMKFYAVIRDKRVIARKVLDRNQVDPNYRYNPNQLYDKCVSRLFKQRLHKEENYLIYFAKRGSKDRTDALRKSLEQARKNFRYQNPQAVLKPFEIFPCEQYEQTGLQAVDYFLWALQRLYERFEDRYWNVIANQVSLIHDVDDTRIDDYGVYYTKRNPLGLNKIQKKPGV